MRDRLLGDLKRKSDDVCNAHKAGIMAQSNGNNLLFTFISLGLTGGASVAAASAAHALSAAATGITGAKAAIDSEVYQDMLVPAILDGIDTSRLQKWNQIADRMKKKVTRDPVACQETLRVNATRSPEEAAPEQEQKIVEKDPEFYTLDQALADIEDYHLRCSFYNGIVTLKDEIATAKKSAGGGTSTPTPSPSASASAKSQKSKKTPTPTPTKSP